MAIIFNTILFNISEKYFLYFFWRTSEKQFDAIQNLIIVADVVMDLVQVHET